MSSKEELDKDGYKPSFKSAHDTMFMGKLFVDKILDKSIMKDDNGDNYIELYVNQYRKKKGAIYVTQIMTKEHLKQDGDKVPNVVGIGFKHISADYYIRDHAGQDYLDYLLSVPHEHPSDV